LSIAAARALGYNGRIMRLALIGDIHLFRLRLCPRQLLSKRLVGQSNLWLNRRFRFDHSLLEPLMQQVQAIEPQMVLCSGDMTSSSLEGEFTDALAFFEPLAKQTPVVIVPGNHDRYTFRSARKRRIEKRLKDLVPQRFPHFQALTDRWSLMALDSAIPQVMMSRGALGKRQLDACARRLAGMSSQEGMVVLCHYPTATPPGVPSSWAHNLAEAETLGQMLATCPARVLYIHGHIHRPWHWSPQEKPRRGLGRLRLSRRSRYAAGDMKLTYLNAGAPCLISNQFPLGQGFWQIDLPDDPGDHVQMIHHIPHRPVRPNGRKLARNGVLRPQWEAHQVL
jgi:hypothetical protein